VALHTDTCRGSLALTTLATYPAGARHLFRSLRQPAKHLVEDLNLQQTHQLRPHLVDTIESLPPYFRLHIEVLVQNRGGN
jgi:hypothetical protein